MLGKLSWDSIPFHEPIPLITSMFVIVGVLGVLIWVWRKGWWPYLWNEYITSTDHKKIGIMYIVLALLMLVRGFTDAIMMRAQQAMAIGSSQGYLPPEHYDQIFTAHGTIMIFFMAMPFVTGVMNYVMPLQIGARDVAFPTMTMSVSADRLRRAVGQRQQFVGESRGRAGGLPAAREKAFSRGGGRLLPCRAADSGVGERC